MLAFLTATRISASFLLSYGMWLALIDFDPNQGLETTIRGGLVGLAACSMILLSVLLAWMQHINRQIQDNFLKALENQNDKIAEIIRDQAKMIERMEEKQRAIIVSIEQSFDKRSEKNLDAFRALFDNQTKQMALCAEAHEMMRKRIDRQAIESRGEG